ncbi:MAG: penicillin acylase family protein [Saprospiraceae bacterium]|nr:penicillin acylase family protein [Saprospiraceae bacterium]
MNKYHLAFCLLLAFPSAVFSQINPANIDIVRDSFGVPHIFAKTDAEVAYGLAWAHCEDDFATLQTCFLASKGLLGQVKGKEGAGVDYVVQAIRARELAVEKYHTLSPDFQRVLEGYCAGFNQFAQTHPKELLHKKLAPITPLDMSTFGVLQLFVFTGGDAALQAILAGEIPLAQLPAAHGSNAYAFNSRKTKDGQVYLNINSHQPWEGIVAWYEAHLCSEEGLNIVGGLFPGAPCILHGCNEYLGWAHTVNNPDKLDVYQLEINPQNPLQYRFDNQWLTLEERSIPLKVKMAGLKIKVHKKAWWSVYGPTFKNKQGMFAIRSSGMFDIRALEEWYRMNKARSFSEFYNILKMEAIPGFNLVYADRSDTIFYLSNGKIPVRQPGYDWLKTLPGNTSRTLWTQFHPLEELPQTLNPASGYLFNSNHSPFNASATSDNLDVARFDPTMGYETYENNRSRRFMELIAPLEKVDYADFKRIKYDQQLPEQISYAVNLDSLLLLSPAQYPDIAPLLDNLKKWNRQSDIRNTGATQFLVLLRYVSHKYQLRTIYQNKTLTSAESLDALRQTQKYLMKHFGRLEVPLGDFQKMVRGNKVRPLAGFPDAIAAIYSKDYKKGMVQGFVGDCLIQLVRFTPQGPVIESVNTFGASNRPESKHYSDQMDMFLEHKTKPMSLDKKVVYGKAERVYHPE